MAYQSINPYNSEVLKSFDSLTDEQVSQALNTAHHCYQDNWSKKSISERCAILKKAAQLMLEQVDDLAKLITLEMGKRIKESEGEVKISAAILDYYATHAQTFLQPKLIKETAEESAWIENHPIGVLVAVEPWNYPYYQLARIAAPNLACGNTLLVKHAHNVPQCALAFEKILHDAGLPKGAYTNIFANSAQVAKLIQDPRTRGVALTGSEKAGQALAMEAGKNLKKSTMELGGSDPFIVLEDCDLDLAVNMAVPGRMSNSGQVCCGSKRFIVAKKIADQFLNAFRERLKVFQPGDPLDPQTNMAPLSSQEALSQLEEQVATAVKHGAKVLLGGKRCEHVGAFMQPTILGDITEENPVFYQEFFGPVALFFVVKNEDEAIKLANNSPYGLGGSVFTQDITRGNRVASQLDTGMVAVNGLVDSSPELPFGGVKNSGYGKELSDMGIKEFLNQKLIVSPKKTI
ncbi:NAD-dependent succinate-semialdehyde dehydrogenase [Neisseria sp. Ec49-e6-T10]|uniref:NAD-dependent succinate-semialdehyde dehydrogenase n=1 Tax=Neisseria sp. Ec49-e6-T10 TaxID=3140744 RepID=UPI003EBCB1AE